MDGASTQAPGPRRERFGYVCRRCLRCCHHRHIQLNPYEVARLARNRGVTTTEFRAAWTEDRQGLALRRTDTGACIFLGAAGCTVYPDRPLVCRLYPLGRHVLADGSESFSHLEPHPQSRGEVTGAGSIADFLEAQDAGPFMQAADEYFLWLARALEGLGTADTDAANISAEGAEEARDLLDMDTAIARHGMAAAIPEPADIEARKELHLTILYQQLGNILGRTP
jgi:hypothetical protein